MSEGIRASRSVFAPAAALALMLLSPPISAQDQPGADEAAVGAAFDAIQAAVVAKDSGRLAQLVHPRFTMQHALGQVDTRQVWFALVADGRLPRQAAELREYDREIVVAGDTALIRGLVRMRYPKEGRASWMRATAVFVRENGRWLQINQQSSYLYDGPVAPPGSMSDYAGSFVIPGREGFSIRPRGDYLELAWLSGAALPLLPTGSDRFAAGPSSTVAFSRGPSGAVEGVERRGGDGALWWTARRSK